jgi:hypothetical protein
LARATPGTQQGFPATARVVQLNRDALVRALERAPREFTPEAAQHSALLTLPLPEGGFARFSIESSSNLEPELAARFPEIKSYRGLGMDDPSLSMRCALSPRGFYVALLSGGQLISIQPSEPTGATDVYFSFSGGTIQQGTVQCLTQEFYRVPPRLRSTLAPNVAVGPTLRNYRIAIAATWEYCNQYGAGTVAGTLASLVTWLNAANVVYERELAIHLNLVNNTNILYTTDRGFTAATDPYDNSNVGTMLDQVRPDLRDKVGAANYDLGHVLGQLPGTGGSGIAFIGVACNNTDFNNLGPIKGGGATLVGGTVGNNTALGVWVHELGHEFGASHSFNGTLGACAPPSRSDASAYEPGSGSTIMAYPSICDADNITNTRDMRFHAMSYAQINSYIASAGNCFTGTPTGNNAPTVNGGPDYTIPKQTPFTLTATGSDPDAIDAPNLTYTWDQADAGGSQFPQNGTPASYNDAADPPTTTRPIFRSFPASSSPSRTFPSLTYILNNANDPPDTVGGFQTAEELPRIGRTLNFRVMIRDNRAGGGGVNDDSVTLTVSGSAGPFQVTAPNTAVSWPGGTTQTVTWNVNGTNALAANVKITLSTDGGQTFPTTLLNSTPNDGSESVTLPNVNTTQARLKIEAVGNIFFDISDTNFTITQSAAVLSITNVNPPAGRDTGGQQIRLTGSFPNLSTVKMGGVTASWVYSNGTSEITVTTPAHTVGAVSIDLTSSTGGTYSKPNAFAYLPTTFTDNTLVAGLTTVKAQHITELRQAVDALRAVAGLPAPAPWTDFTLQPFSTVIKAIHIIELRAYLEDAAGRLGYATGSYTDSMLTSGYVIKRVHIEELRQRIRTIAG